MGNYTEEEKQHWLSEWELSGLSVRAYVQGKPFCLASFNNWRRRASNNKKATSFIELTSITSNPPLGYVRLTYPSGVVLEFHDRVDILTLRALVQ